ncbi:hypothetical protein Pan97_34800 [Bremerella volcania]|uniref:Uncharacterized protein n=2 Tax=Bremerella volcania TaxID=2527984 RepID=A0A518CB33_9BACT|nr:hypothetical protein Pan97_34800 [Bremerella volcania]
MIQQTQAPNEIHLASNRRGIPRPEGGWPEIVMDDNTRHPLEINGNLAKEKALSMKVDSEIRREGQQLLRKLLLIPRASYLAIAATEGIPDFNMPVSESQLWAFETSRAITQKRNQILQWILTEVGPIAESALADLVKIIDANRDRLEQLHK